MQKNAVIADNPPSLLRLFFPICMETLLMILAGTVDTLMLSAVDNQFAVGAVGTANTYLSTIFVLFNIASTGMVAVMTHYIGAKRENIAHRSRSIGFAFNAVLGAIFSLFLVFFSRSFLRLLGTSEVIAQPAETYLRIVGGFCFLNALISIFSGHLRAFGQTKLPFYAAVASNIVNVVLNAYFLFGVKSEVQGVAIATVISRVFNLVLLVFWSERLHARALPDKSVPSRVIIRQILSIGIPSAFENVFYSVAVSITVGLINRYDPSGFAITVRSYALQVAAFTHCASLSFGSANSILVGWFIGARRENECTHTTRVATAYSIGVSLLIGGATAIFAPYYMPLFTNDPAMISMIQAVLFINLILEVGRSVNVCYGNALKAIGDARFPLYAGVVFMFLAAAGGMWMFASVFNISPAIACFLGMMLDECARALCMLVRWRSGAWRKKILVPV